MEFIKTVISSGFKLFGRADTSNNDVETPGEEDQLGLSANAPNNESKEKVIISLLKRKDKRIEYIKSLIESDSRLVNCKDDFGNSVLHLAIAKFTDDEKDASFISFLLEKGADVKAKIEGEYTPFLYSALKDKFGVLKLLADCEDNDVNAQNKDGNTALHLAVEYGHVDSVAVLHDLSKTHNLREDFVNKNGQMTALQLAKSKNPVNTTIVEILEDKFQRRRSRVAVSRGDSYTIESDPRGICLILQNEDFGDPKWNRTGCKDAEILKEAFEKLNFKVESYKDRTALEMYDLIKKYSKMNHEDYDCFVLCISSHGKGDSIYGTDKKLFPVKEIIKLFTSTNCKSLSEKPKLFFLNACRSTKPTFETNVTKETSYKEESCDGGNEILNSLIADEDPTACEPDGNITNKEKLSTMDDIFEGHSTPEGFNSYREGNKETCVSIYFDELCKTLKEHAKHTEFQHLITSVNLGVTNRNVHVPSPINRLRKQLWFF